MNNQCEANYAEDPSNVLRCQLEAGHRGITHMVWTSRWEKFCWTYSAWATGVPISQRPKDEQP